MHERKILRKSDLWPFATIFGVMTLSCLALVGIHLARGENGAAFTMAIAALLPLVLALVCAFTDRSEAMRRAELFDAEPAPVESSRWASRLSEELDAPSCLDPDASGRATRATSDDPPDIG